MRKYFQIYKSYLSIGLEYRAEIITTIILELIMTASIFVLWLAIFKTHDTIQGFNQNQLLLYYLLVPVIGHITQIKISRELGQEIKDGILSNYLLKPYQVWLSWLMKSLAQKTNLLFIILPFYSLIILIFSLFNQTHITTSSILIALLIAIFGISIHFTLDLIITWSSFWLEDVWFFNHLKNIIFGIFSGKFIPFQLLPRLLLLSFSFLPFKFLYFIPINYLINQPHLSQIRNDIIQASLWILILASVSILMWKKGIQKYEAYGR